MEHERSPGRRDTTATRIRPRLVPPDPGTVPGTSSAAADPGARGGWRRVARWAVPAAAIVVAVAVVAVGAVLASGPSPSAKKSPRIAAPGQPAGSAADGGAASAAPSGVGVLGVAPKATKPPTNPKAAPGGFPGPGNTGPLPGVALKVDSTQFKVVNTDGAVLENLDIRGNLEIDANNVTIRNVRVRCTNEKQSCFTLRQGHHGMRMDHVDVGGGANGTTMSPTATGITLQRSDTRRGFGDNVIDHTAVHHIITGFIPDGFVTIQNSWVHDLDNFDGPEVHAGGIHFMSEGQTLLYHNRVEAGSTANIFIQELDGVCESNIVMDSNLIPGLTTTNHVGQTVRPTYGIQADSCKPSTIVAKNNVFTKNGPSTYDTGLANPELGWTASNWFGNRFLEDSAPAPLPK